MGLIKKKKNINNRYIGWKNNTNRQARKSHGEILKIKRKKIKKQKHRTTYCTENTIEKSTANEDSINSKKNANSLERYKNKDVSKNCVQREKNYLRCYRDNLNSSAN